jgi:hypothetical protein
VARIDLGATISTISFPPEVWEWLDLLGDVWATTQRQPDAFQASGRASGNLYRRILIQSINKDITSLLSIYVLLRMEMIHQAAAHVRLLCEGLVTLTYISLDPIERAKLFDGYAEIEQYEVPKSMFEWGQKGASPADIQRMENLLKSMEPNYRKAQQTYTFVDKAGKRRKFSNWCNKSLAEQAKECGSELERLYRIVYKQTSAYIHGSSWSLRRQLGYSRAHYRPEVVHNDIAMIVKLTVGVWYEWAKFCDAEVGWRLTPEAAALVVRHNALEQMHFGRL